MGFEELAKIIGPRWKAVTPEQKNYYKAQAEKEGARYRTQLDEYHKSGTFTPHESEFEAPSSTDDLGALGRDPSSLRSILDATMQSNLHPVEATKGPQHVAMGMSELHPMSAPGPATSAFMATMAASLPPQQVRQDSGAGNSYLFGAGNWSIPPDTGTQRQAVGANAPFGPSMTAAVAGNGLNPSDPVVFGDAFGNARPGTSDFGSSGTRFNMGDSSISGYQQSMASASSPSLETNLHRTATSTGQFHPSLINLPRIQHASSYPSIGVSHSANAASGGQFVQQPYQQSELEPDVGLDLSLLEPRPIRPKDDEEARLLQQRGASTLGFQVANMSSFLRPIGPGALVAGTGLSQQPQQQSGSGQQSSDSGQDNGQINPTGGPQMPPL
mmetsp:Transcript_22274/g.46444  ORF Transcript_22274/g.46444 Transcript_22274/m.46444 type:complete len:385 (-) Transcript_22274:2161-3315(-)